MESYKQVLIPSLKLMRKINFQIRLPYRRTNVRIQENMAFEIVNILARNRNYFSSGCFYLESRAVKIFFFFSLYLPHLGGRNSSVPGRNAIVFIKTFLELWKLFNIWLRHPPCFSEGGHKCFTPIF